MPLKGICWIIHFHIVIIHYFASTPEQLTQVNNFIGTFKQTKSDPSP